MGLSFGGGSSSSTSNQTETANKTFSAGQTALQDQLGSTLSTNLSAAQGGTLSPGVQTQKTAAADQINKNAGGLQDRLQRFLAQRGFGSSGESGKVALSGELQRESDLAANNANFAQVQQTQNGQSLLAALNYALTSLGMTGTATGSSSGSNFGWNANAHVPGFGN